MTLDQIVPWGRTLAEYRRMFNLTDGDFAKRILGVGDGPASFNAEMTVAGHTVVSIDPIYDFSATELRKRIDETYDVIMAQVHKHTNQYNWTFYQNAEQLGSERMNAMNRFLSDYEDGQRQGRYRTGTLPELPLSDQSFDIALCSHLLFLYSDQLSESVHWASIRSLVRVANEVRIFPLITLNGQSSPYLLPMLAGCQSVGIQSEVVAVDYHFQKGAQHMLRLTKSDKQV